jgi:hypothetical protein
LDPLVNVHSSFELNLKGEIMAASKSQGRAFTLFMAGLTAAAAGIAFSSSGVGKLSLGAGLIVFAVSLGMFLKIKPLEGKVALGEQPAVMKLIGVAVALAGWLVVLFGIHLTASVAGRMTTSILGLAIALVGVLYILPTAASKNAIWKA